MKYITIQKVVEAEQLNIYKDKCYWPRNVVSKYIEDIGTCIVIESDQENVRNILLEDGDWIITESDGTLRVMNDEQFKKTFQETDWEEK